jgi:hypothetical protein
MSVCASFVGQSVAVLLLLGGDPAVERHILAPGLGVSEAVILEHDLLSFPAIEIVEIDGQALPRRLATKADVERAFPGRVWKLPSEYVLTPGRHTVRMRPAADADILYPDTVVFEAGAGQRYRLVNEPGNVRSEAGDETTLHFNFYAPLIVQGTRKAITRVAGPALPTFGMQRDATDNLLLYEDASLPAARTARVLLRGGSHPGAISGRSGAVQIRYRMYRKEKWQFRVLPGDYVFQVVYWLEPVGMASARSLTEVAVPLHAEAGHTYRLKENIGSRGHEVGPGTAVTSWAPAFEDVTPPARD